MPEFSGDSCNNNNNNDAVANKDGVQQQQRKLVWNVRSSEFAKNTFNPIRSIVDSMKLEPHPEKYMIALSIGDPTIFGNLKPHEAIIEAVQNTITSMKFNGYAPTTGYGEAWAAVAEYYSTQSSAPVLPNWMFPCFGLVHLCGCLKRSEHFDAKTWFFHLPDFGKWIWNYYEALQFIAGEVLGSGLGTLGVAH